MQPSSHLIIQSMISRLLSGLAAISLLGWPRHSLGPGQLSFNQFDWATLLRYDHASFSREIAGQDRLRAPVLLLERLLLLHHKQRIPAWHGMVLHGVVQNGLVIDHTDTMSWGLPSEDLVLAQTLRSALQTTNCVQRSEDHRQGPFSRLSPKYPVWTRLRLDYDLCWRLWRPKRWSPNRNPALESGPGRMMYGSNLARKSPVVDPSEAS